MTNRTGAHEPKPSTAQMGTNRRRILDAAATALNTASFALQLTDHQLLAAAARAMALLLRTLNNALDTRANTPPYRNP